MAVAVQDRFGDPTIVDDPFDYYGELRDEAPVFFAPSVGAYVVSRFADLQFVTGNPEIFSSSPPADDEVGNLNFSRKYVHIYEEAGVPPQCPTLVVTDGEQHMRYRGIVDRPFTPAGVKQMHGQITAIVDGLIDRFIDDGRVDLHQRFALKVPLYLMCGLLGLPISDEELLAGSAEAMTRLNLGRIETPENIEMLHRRQAAFHRYLLDHLDTLRRRPDDSMISGLLRWRGEDGAPLSDEEVLSFISILNIGGNETTTAGIANMLLLMIERGWEDRLRADRALIPRFIEEMLRLDSPVISMPRWVTRDVAIGGVTVPAGAVVLISYGAANRDERQFARPAEIDVERKGLRNHVGFGAGSHYCLGASLARLEMNVALNRVLDRMRGLRLDNGGRPLRYQFKISNRTLTGLPVRFERIAEAAGAGA